SQRPEDPGLDPGPFPNFNRQPLQAEIFFSPRALREIEMFKIKSFLLLAQSPVQRSQPQAVKVAAAGAGKKIRSCLQQGFRLPLRFFFFQKSEKREKPPVILQTPAGQGRRTFAPWPP